ncbi:MAG: glycine-rich domain-containing protein [Fimbriimonadaceae bacterium]
MANLTNAALYQAIINYQIDDPNVALPFEKRLARENGWTLSFSRRIIEEYKKFIYLCIAAGHPCTPSDEVDQAWHLHMLYTSSYFDRLCQQILGKTIAHEPTKGGDDEGEKFHDWYAKTLGSYRDQFGSEPPADIWPPSEIRFGNAPRFRRINVKENIIISKKRIRKLAFGSIASTVGLTVIGCSLDGPWRTEQVNDTLQAIAIAIVVILLLVALINYIRNGGGGNRGGCSGGCGASSGSACSSGCGSGCGGGCGGGD